MSVNTVYYFSSSSQRTDLHLMLLEWEPCREGGRSREGFTWMSSQSGLKLEK